MLPYLKFLPKYLANIRFLHVHIHKYPNQWFGQTSLLWKTHPKDNKLLIGILSFHRLSVNPLVFNVSIPFFTAYIYCLISTRLDV